MVWQRFRGEQITQSPVFTRVHRDTWGGMAQLAPRKVLGWQPNTFPARFGAWVSLESAFGLEQGGWERSKCPGTAQLALGK